MPLSNPLHNRLAGVLLHVTSLPGGRLDQQVERWLEFLHESGLRIWQVLPMVIPDHTGSPYQSCSAFAINPDLLPEPYQPVIDEELAAYENEAFWLDDFALFMVLKERYGNLCWNEWPDAYRYREQQALQELRLQESDRIHQIKTTQFLLEKRWQQIRLQAKKYGISLFGDLPFFVALDSADVWANPDEFLLDDELKPTLVAGVPPDYFSETGQLWGNPQYDWQQMQSNDFDWWKKRLLNMFSRFDIVRVDHFRGFEASWMIDAAAETAIDGYWQKNPGEALLAELKKELGDLPIVAEDLGIITPEVTALRKQFNLPGMSVLQFAFDGFDDNPHKPKNVTEDCVFYSGTHDNNTTMGWYSHVPDHEKGWIFQVLGVESCDNICQCFTDVTYHSAANTVILPLQDFLNLGEEARMNVPGQIEGNWRWQFDWTMIDDELAPRLKKLATETNRIND